MPGCHSAAPRWKAPCRLVGDGSGRVGWRRTDVHRVCVWRPIRTCAWLGFYRPSRSARSDLMPIFPSGAFAAKPLHAIARPKLSDHRLAARRTPRAISRLATRVHVRPRCRRPRKSGRWRITARSNGICPSGPCNVAVNAARPLSISLSMPRIWLGMIVTATDRINSQRSAAIRNDLASVTKCFGMLQNVSF